MPDYGKNGFGSNKLTPGVRRRELVPAYLLEIFGSEGIRAALHFAIGLNFNKILMISARLVILATAKIRRARSIFITYFIAEKIWKPTGNAQII